MSQGEYEQFQAAMEIGDHSGSLQEIINLTENLDCYDVYPDIRDHDDLGRYYIEELNAMQVPEHLRNYIDYEAYGRDVALGENGRRKYNKVCKGCVHPCKQSFRAVLISCPHYQSARSKKCGDRG